MAKSGDGRMVSAWHASADSSALATSITSRSFPGALNI